MNTTATSVTYFDAEAAHEKTIDNRDKFQIKIEAFTDKYMCEVIHNEIEHAVAYGLCSLTHIIPRIRIDVSYLESNLACDGFKVKRFGRLLIIKW